MKYEITEILEKYGPLTGEELKQKSGSDDMNLWRECRLSSSIEVRQVGCRYLRLDRRVEGYARLSPSILRGFLTYSIIGNGGQVRGIEDRAAGLLGHIEAVSREKLDIAYRLVSAVCGELGLEGTGKDPVCFIIGGDIVYNMAHDVPRPERSTKMPVNGSDMDLVVVAGDEIAEHTLRRLDESLFLEKERLLMAPHMREELDYVVKRLDKVERQLRFDSFRHMLACKILDEGAFLYGDEELFRKIKHMILNSGVKVRLKELDERARVFRKEAESFLLQEDENCIGPNCLNLFYPSDESEEFE